MLTDSEREWLNSRRSDLVSPGAYFCGQCEVQCFTLEKPCPLQITGKNWRDAAEFEARVAKRLAFMAVNRNEESPCNKREPCDPVSCYSCWIKTARLEVEEEMDAQVLHS